MKIIWKPIFFVFFLRVCYSLLQGVKVGTLSRQNERKSSYVRLAHTSIFGLCFMSVCLLKSNCYSLIYSSLVVTYQYWETLVCTLAVYENEYRLTAFLLKLLNQSWANASDLVQSETIGKTKILAILV